MVGTPRRTGCETCRIRKKKCGEEYPACKACVSAQFPCPGYAKKWKFVPENKRVASLYTPKRDNSMKRTGAVAVTWKSLENTSQVVVDLSVNANRIMRDFRPRICHFRASEHERTAYLLGYLLLDRRARKALPVVAQGSFYAQLPRRLGSNSALHASVACLCHIWMDLTMNRNTNSEAVALYVKGLNALQSCLDDAQTQYESETICASIILQLCELALSADNGRWASLSKGTKLLIQNCGPARFTRPFEYSMLESQRAFFICHDMNDGQHCFLSLPEWRQLFSDMRKFSTGRASISLRSAGCDLLVDVPEIFFQGTRLRDQDSKEPEFYLELLNRATTMRNAIEVWYDEKLLPLVASDTFVLNGHVSQTQSPNAHNACHHRYDDILMAVSDSILNTVIISLHHLTACLRSDLPTIHHDEPDLPVSRLTMAERLVISQSALAYVQNHSRLASKPLEFSLNLLRSYPDGLLDSGVMEIGGPAMNTFSIAAAG